MNTCDTCKHWESCDAYGICNHPMVYRPTYGPTRRDQRHTDKFAPDRVMTMDEGGGTGELYTGPKFGCIHQEPKP